MDKERNHHSIDTFAEVVNKVLELAAKGKLQKTKRNLDKRETHS